MEAVMTDLNKKNKDFRFYPALPHHTLVNESH